MTILNVRDGSKSAVTPDGKQTFRSPPPGIVGFGEYTPVHDEDLLQRRQAMKVDRSQADSARGRGVRRTEMRGNVSSPTLQGIH
jgi:hypothetical protein